MSSSLYITSTRARAGKTVVALGAAELLAREVGRVAVFRPVVPDPTANRPTDPIVELLIDRFSLDQDPATVGCLTYSEVASLAAAGDLSAITARVLDEFAKLDARYDFVIVVGSDFTGPAPSTELELNATLAANLGAPVVPVVGAADMAVERIPAAVSETTRVLAHHGCTVVATVISNLIPRLTHALPSPRESFLVQLIRRQSDPEDGRRDRVHPRVRPADVHVVLRDARHEPPYGVLVRPARRAVRQPRPATPQPRTQQVVHRDPPSPRQLLQLVAEHEVLFAVRAVHEDRFPRLVLEFLEQCP